MPISLFPLNSGVNQQVDTRLLPDGALADAVNVELDREGRLIGRAKYTAQAATVYQTGTLVAYDLVSFNDRLFAFGDAHGYGYPCDLYEYLPDGNAARWRPTSAKNAESPRLPRATRIRDIARPPDQEGGISNMGCAAFGGYACLVWNSAENVSLGYVHVVSAEKNQTLLFQGTTTATFPFDLLRVVALSDRFIILGAEQTTSDINAIRFIPASDENLVAVATDLFTGAITTYTACKVAGSDEFCVVCNIGGTVTLKRFNASCVEQVPSGGAYASKTQAATALAVEASATANQVTIAMVVGGEARLFSYNLTTGAEIGAGPHVPFSGETSVEISLARSSSTVLQVVSSVTSETAPSVFCRPYTVSTNAFGTLVRGVTDAQLTTSAVFTDELFFGIRVGEAGVGNTPNMLVSSGSALFSGGREVTPQIVKDLEVASTVSALLPDIAHDSTTGKYYWCNASATPDGASSPMLTEFELESTDRRQTTQLGNLLYIAGGCPLVFDGLTLSEMGFQTRPRIISLTPSDGAGVLLPGGVYDYRCHWEWIDSDGNLHLSPPSEITSVTMGASEDTVTAVVTSPHSLRRNNGAPSGTVACVLSRTLATVRNTAATLLGRATVDPPAASLNGLTLFVLISDSTGYNLYTITFDSGSTDTAAIVADINAVVDRVTATNENGHIRLTADETGDGAFLEVSGGTSIGILGFIEYENDTGTTTYTKGENFQRTAVEFASSTVAVAPYVTVVDTRADQSDPIVDDDLIRQQVLYSQGIASGAHHAPPPCEYIWAGRERVVVAGQPKRGRFTASKLLVPAEPAEFAFEGFLAFSGQVSGDIEAMAVLGDSIIAWTRREIWEISGSGPGRNGLGEFFAARRISKAGGLVAGGWRSLVETDEGIYFQRKSDQLCQLDKNGSVTWIGRAIQDYLILYPVVVAGVYVSSKHSVAFACQSEDGLTGGILRFDVAAKAWFFDDVGAVASLAEFDGRLAYVQAGLVYIQDEAPGVGTFVPFSVETGMFQGFQALGWGQVNRIGFLGAYRGPCTVTATISADGETFDAMASWSLTDAEYDPGDRVQLLKEPALQMRDSFATRFAVTHDDTDSEGVWLHAVALDTTQSPELARRGPAHNR